MRGRTNSGTRPTSKRVTPTAMPRIPVPHEATNGPRKVVAGLEDALLEEPVPRLQQGGRLAARTGLPPRTPLVQVVPKSRRAPQEARVTPKHVLVVVLRRQAAPRVLEQRVAAPPPTPLTARGTPEGRPKLGVGTPEADPAKAEPEARPVRAEQQDRSGLPRPPLAAVPKTVPVAQADPVERRPPNQHALPRTKGAALLARVTTQRKLVPREPGRTPPQTGSGRGATVATHAGVLVHRGLA